MTDDDERIITVLAGLLSNTRFATPQNGAARILKELRAAQLEVVVLPDPDPETLENRRPGNVIAHFGTIDVFANGSVDDDYHSTSVEYLRSGAATALAAARFIDENFRAAPD